MFGPEESSVDKGFEKFAEDFSSAVVDIALRESQHVQDPTEDAESSVSSWVDTRKEKPEGLTFLHQYQRSLEYPNAPPTTPVLPEPRQSKRSFNRKLKGSLANVFLPSPPPPTPKDQTDDQPELHFMDQVMHSLSSEVFEVGHPFGFYVEVFAEALSVEIMDLVLCGKSEEKNVDGSGLNRLAQKMAECIISSSVDEAKSLNFTRVDYLCLD
ncbi:uncharacterized protein LOC114480358 [Gouania willdenowi]|uniref:uncharacterized protein LOC114480358 n=1 Tax=Gouania willdenowi TaxID=441366 RepID=UPI0010542F34|nr:uncharacterized protein LOC114480358 [Gouania willdenowi]